jgi:two-component system CheB/CheR fusion protein
MREAVFRGGQPVVSNDPSSRPRAALLPAGQVPLDNVLVAPMRLHGRTVGVLGLANKRGGFTEVDAERTMRFGDLAATVLHLGRVTDSLERAEERFRAIADRTIDAIVAVDREGCVRFWNRSAERMFGRSKDEVLGEPFSNLIAEGSRGTFDGRAVPSPVSLVLTGLRQSGQEFPIEFACAGWDPEVPGLCTAIVRDLTERHREEERSARLQQELERQVEERTTELLRMNQKLQEEIEARTLANAQLASERAKLRGIMHAMRDGVAIIGPHHDLRYINPALERDFGPADDRLCHEYFHGRETPCARCINDDVVAGKSVHCEWSSSATDKTYDVFATPLRDPDGHLSKLSIFHDISERKRIEDALRESQRLIERIADTTPDILYVYDVFRRSHPYVNRRLTDVLGYPAETFAADSEGRVMQIIHPDDRGIRARRLARLATARDDEVIETEYRLRHARGDYRTLLFRDAVFNRSADGAVQQIAGIVRDVTELRRLESGLLQASEVERRRIGQDLHDGLGQVLAGVALLGKRLELQVQAKVLPELADMRRLVTVVVEAMDQVRALAGGLFPVALETAGLHVALDELARHVAANFGVQCEARGSEHALALAPVQAIHFYRIAQEAVRNAVRHGHANFISIALDQTAESTVLSVLDDGVGIDDEALRGGGMGLLSMQCRARLLGAIVEVRRHPGGGTLVTCMLGAEPGSDTGTEPRSGSD